MDIRALHSSIPLPFPEPLQDLGPTPTAVLVLYCILYTVHTGSPWASKVMARRASHLKSRWSWRCTRWDFETDGVRTSILNRRPRPAIQRLRIQTVARGRRSMTCTANLYARPTQTLRFGVAAPPTLHPPMTRSRRRRKRSTNAFLERGTPRPMAWIAQAQICICTRRVLSKLKGGPCGSCRGPRCCAAGQAFDLPHHYYLAP
ncbi:hypothetical protein BD414DRAFT_18850 [Trametes punicea]|nr:hypothetical protein BD414DRAFT_18850 [Trametes punicea]